MTKKKSEGAVDVVRWKGSEQLRASLVELGELHTDPENARKHDARNLGAIRASLLHFGQQKPIVVDVNGRVIAGNGTLAAAAEAGWTHLAVVRSDLTDPVSLRAFGIADNRTAELAEWDFEILATALTSLPSEMSIGFDSDDIAAMTAAPFFEEGDAVPEARSSLPYSIVRVKCLDATKLDEVREVISRALGELPEGTAEMM